MCKNTMPKSVLDGIMVHDKGCLLTGNKGITVQLVIVGHCPHCGAPIYGPKSVVVGPPIEVRYSCNCWRKQRTIENTMETK